MVNVPFMGSLIANENLIFVAFINILEALLKLGIAIFLVSIATNQLITYAWLMTAVAFFTLLLYMAYCFRKFEECTIKELSKVNREQIVELSSFAGWNLFGALCSLGRNQGLTILLNLFFGPVMNAAYGIANQVSSQMNFLSVTMLTALNPQIMKSEGSNDRKRMLRLSMIASKFGFFLVAIVAVPAIFEMSNILEFWLKEVPEYSGVFAQIILISILVNQITVGLQSALQATGEIKWYQIIVGGTILLTVPLAYLFLKMGFPPYSVFISYLIFEILAVVMRLLLAKKIAKLSIQEYFKSVIFRALIPFFIQCLICYYISNYWNIEFRFILTGVLSSIFFISSIYILGLSKDEKNLVLKFMGDIIRKFKNK